MEKPRGTEEALKSPSPPPLPPTIPSNGQPEILKPPKYSIVSRREVGTNGRKISLLANHFKVSVNSTDAVFYQYTVTIFSEDRIVVESKRIGRKLVDKLYQTYSSELAGKRFAYDGEKCLYTVGPLPQNKFEFTIVVEESFAKLSPDAGGGPPESGKRAKRSFRSKTYIVELSYSAKIPLKSVSPAQRAVESDNRSQDALRVLDITLRQQAADRGCLLVRQSFFQDDSRNYVDVEGGILGLRGFHSSFRPTQGGLSLNMDVSTTMVLRPGPVFEFLKQNLNVKDELFWTKAKRVLKNMRIKTVHRNMEFKIIGLSEKPCSELYFPMKVKNGGTGDAHTVEITVYEYFTKHCGIELTYSADMPCIAVGKPKCPIYLPLEVCSLVSLQRYTKALSLNQRATLVERSRQKPRERIQTLTDALRSNKFNENHVFIECGISISRELTEVDGRILETPRLKVGNNEDCIPRNGRWNFNNKKLLDPKRIERWIGVNFSARCDLSKISRDLISCARNKGAEMERPHTLIEEDRQQAAKASPAARVEAMFEQIIAKLPGPPDFILCVLPVRKNSDIYGPWKKKCLCDMGIVTQCISPGKITDQYLTNVLLKINSKLGGINSLLEIERPSNLPLIKDTPTLILGMDVSHGSPGRSDVPSIAAVVGSLHWPLISRYRASVRTQSPKMEMIEALYKPSPDGKVDDGIIRELLLDFYRTSGSRKPKQIIIFRDGAYQLLGESGVPKFMVVVAQKNHRTKLFQANAPENIPPGTVVDTKIVHPINYDFYMCAHAGIIGTSRPAHYHVLLDEIRFSPNDLQNLIHALSYVYQRSTTATSIVAPICYAHQAAHQVGQFLKFEDLSETSSGNVGSILVPDLPRLKKNVAGSMFFC